MTYGLQTPDAGRVVLAWVGIEGPYRAKVVRWPGCFAWVTDSGEYLPGVTRWDCDGNGECVMVLDKIKKNRR